MPQTVYLVVISIPSVAVSGYRYRSVAFTSKDEAERVRKQFGDLDPCIEVELDPVIEPPFTHLASIHEGSLWVTPAFEDGRPVNKHARGLIAGGYSEDEAIANVRALAAAEKAKEASEPQKV
jgi:hypothetical protein